MNELTPFANQIAKPETFDEIRIGIASPDKIRSWSFGGSKKPETTSSRTVEPLRVEPQGRDRLIGTGRTFVVVDTVGAGQGEMVLIVQGSSARLTPETEKLPVDCTIIGIV